MKWININDRLPPKLKNVIYKTSKPLHFPEGMCNRTIFYGYWNGYGWSDENSTTYTHVENVIEWLGEAKEQ